MSSILIGHNYLIQDNRIMFFTPPYMQSRSKGPSRNYQEISKWTDDRIRKELDRIIDKTSALSKARRECVIRTAVNRGIVEIEKE